MKNVYIVTSGSYSDYSINAVFDNEDAAKSFAAVYSETQVEIFELNSSHAFEGLQCFIVTMSKNGDVISIWKVDSPSDMHSKTAQYSVNRVWDKLTELRIHVTCFAKDEAHAIKIAGEKRRVAIANGEFDLETL